METPLAAFLPFDKDGFDGSEKFNGRPSLFPRMGARLLHAAKWRLKLDASAFFVNPHEPGFNILDKR